MVKLQVFDIIFDHPQAVFHSGDVVGGKVVMELSEPMKMRNLRITLSGKGYVHWSRTSGTGKNRHTNHYRSDESYFEPTFILFGNEEGEADHHPSGTFEYRFTLHLDTELPSSFEGEYGHVRYYAKAVIDKPWKFDHEVKVPFTVIHNLDLNLEPPTIKTPMQGEDNSTVSCCCCWSGNVHAMIRIARQGYVPGEAIKIYAKVTNQSNTEVINTRIALKQYMEYYGACDGFFTSSERRSKTISDVVASIDREGVPAGETQTWDNVPLTIPPLPPSRLIGCECINIAYVVKFYVSVNCGNDLKLACEIVIGAIPLHDVIAPPTPLPGRPQSEDVQPSKKKLPAPPTYQQCVRGEVSIADDSDTEFTRGRLNYAPCYPFYTLPVPGNGQGSQPGSRPGSRHGSRHGSRQPSIVSQHSKQTSPSHPSTSGMMSSNPTTSALPPPPQCVQPHSISGVQTTDINIGYRDFKEQRV